VNNIMRTAFAAVSCAVLTVALSAPADAQSAYGTAQSVTSADIQRLQDQVYDASSDVSRLRTRDQALADRLQGQLDDLRDEVVYLKVKLRKEGSVGRGDYDDVRNRLQDIRTQARNDMARQGGGTWTTGGSSSGSDTGYRGGTGAPTSGSGGYSGGTQDRQTQTPRATGRRNEVPAGQELDVRLERELNSGTAQVEDRFEATTMVDLTQGNDVLIPAGSVLRGVVSSVTKATRTERQGKMTVAFDQITVRGRNYPIHATVTQAIQSEGIKGEMGKIGAGAGVGAIIGGILGGAKGALLGILIGGGGTIAATEGKDVDLPAGTVLRIKFDEPLQIR
jgi:TolA-binding protein